MPNHVRNVWRIKNIPADKVPYLVNKFTLTLEDGNKIMDFDLIIPQPRYKKDCPRDCIVNSKSHVQEDKDRPWFNWYDWNCKYWNTKWGAYDGYTKIGKTQITFVFSTAWSFAAPVVKELAEFCKENGYDLDIKYADEDYGSNCGWQIYDHTTDEWSLKSELKPNPGQWARNLWNNY